MSKVKPQELQELNLDLYKLVRDYENKDQLQEIERQLTDGSINNIYNKGKTLLHAAVENGNSELIILYLISKGADVNIRDNEGRSPLHYAANNGMNAICEELINSGAEVNAKDMNGSTALHLAALQKESKVVMSLLKGGAKDSRNNSNMMALDIAAEKGDEYSVNYLVKLDKSEIRLFSLHHAVEGGNLNVIEDLIKKDKRLVKYYNDFGSPLHLAAKLGKKEICELLIKEGASTIIEARTKPYDGCIALHFAAMNGYKEICELLIEKDRRCIDWPNMSGNTPLHMAAIAGNIEIINLLIKKGADINYKAANGDKVFNILARKIGKDPEIVAKLIKGKDQNELAALASNVIKNASGYIKDDNETWKLVQAIVDKVPEGSKIAVVTEVLKSLGNSSRRARLCGFVSEEDREMLKDIKPDSLWRKIVNRFYKSKDKPIVEQPKSFVQKEEVVEKKADKNNEISLSALSGVKLSGVSIPSGDDSKNKESFVEKERKRNMENIDVDRGV